MFDARSVKRLVILLLVLAAGGIAVPSMAQMGGGIERSIVSNAVQNATQSARDQQKGGAASKTAKADTKAKSAPELAGVKSKEAKKPLPEPRSRQHAIRAAFRRPANSVTSRTKS